MLSKVRILFVGEIGGRNDELFVIVEFKVDTAFLIKFNNLIDFFKNKSKI